MVTNQEDSDFCTNFRISFESGGRISCVTFDTCFWISKLTDEENHADPTKKESAIQMRKIYDFFTSTEKVVLLDTITWEFRQIIFDKFNTIYKEIWSLLKQAKDRVEDGEREFNVAKEMKQSMLNNPHLSTFYSYLESRGLGFLTLLRLDNRVRLLQLLLDEKDKLLDYFESFASSYFTIKVKELIFMWIADNAKTFKEFSKSTPGIGKKDRYHILGCYFGSCDRFDYAISFVTVDSTLLSLTSLFQEFFSERRIDLRDQLALIREKKVLN